jgi:hypothetical protein
VSGNGTGFVWQLRGRRGGSAEEEQVVESALEDAVEAGLVAVDEGQIRRAFGEGGGDAAELVAGPVGHAVFEDAGLDGPGAALAPAGGDHLLDGAELDVVDRAEPFEELSEKLAEAVAVLVGEDDLGGEEPVADGVPRRFAFSFGCFRSPRACAVGTSGEDLSKR